MTIEETTTRIADEAFRQSTGGFSAESDAMTALELIRQLAIEVRRLAAFSHVAPENRR